MKCVGFDWYGLCQWLFSEDEHQAPGCPLRRWPLLSKWWWWTSSLNSGRQAISRQKRCVQQLPPTPKAAEEASHLRNLWERLQLECIKRSEFTLSRASEHITKLQGLCVQIVLSKWCWDMTASVRNDEQLSNWIQKLSTNHIFSHSI